MPLFLLVPLAVIAYVAAPWLVPLAGRLLGALGLIGPGLARWDDPLRRPASWGDLVRLARTSHWYGWAVRRGFLTWPATSGFRAPALNATLQAASATSLHMKGLAADGRPTGPSYQTAQRILADARATFWLWRPPLQEVGWYTSGHVHIGIAPWGTTPAFRLFAGGDAG